MNNNQLQTRKEFPATVNGMTDYLTDDVVKQRIVTICGRQEGDKLISNLISNIQQNPTLAECDKSSVVSAALAGHALHLDFALQQAYMIPFNNTKKKTKEAQFCIGWKGYMQMALRSGQYKKINAVAIKEGEFKGFNPLTEDYMFSFEQDFKKRASLPTTHYACYLQLTNGFTKTFVMSKEQMERHARKYSKAYAYDLKTGGNSSFWTKDFDSQGCKTVLRQAISKFGVMSTEMKQAYKQDMAVLDENGNPEYVDNPNNYESVEAEEVNETTGEIIENIPTEQPKKLANDDQVNILCRIIANKGMNVADFFSSRRINPRAIDIDTYNNLLKELQ